MKRKGIVLAILLTAVSCDSSEEKEEQKEPKTTEKTSTEEKIEDSADQENLNEMNCTIDFSAYINDPSRTATNIRKSPGGEVFVQLTNAVDHEIHLIDKSGSWFQLDKVVPFDYDSDGDPITYDIPEGNAWVHSSVLEVGTRNYGQQEMKLFAEPSEDAEVINTITIELYGVPIDACGDFIKIKANSGDRIIEGWIKKEWVCANPVTTCS